MYSTAIVSSRVESGTTLEVCLRQTGLIGPIHRWTLSREQSRGAAEPTPDFLIMDFSHDSNSCIAQIATLRSLRPNLLILAWTPEESPNAGLLLSAMRNGVQDFLPARVDPVAYKEILTRCIRQAGIVNSSSQAKLAVVMGVKGGAGTTTVAVNIGVQLANLTQKRITLLDFARPMGHVSIFLDLQPRFSVCDSIDNLDRLDSHLLDGLLTQHKSGLSVLAGTSRPDDWLRLPVSGLARVANVAQSSSDFVLVDLSMTFPNDWGSVLNQADKLILVAGADAISLWNLERHVSVLQELGIGPEKVQVVVNRWHHSDDEALTNFQRKTSCQIIARLPNDFKQVSEAITVGVPLSKNHGDPLGTRFRALACELAGVSPRPVVQKKVRSWVSLFTLNTGD